MAGAIIENAAASMRLSGNIYLRQEWALILFRWRQKNLNARHTGMKPPKFGDTGSQSGLSFDR
jgi:hypothetical protein